ncbi:uncharacterized protein LOC117112612, partial [Anneissia japonica]|uniref:uncharacterized protein LOC117112612 n=1 Tax=Anneissia japonica TaxID=1529436 RepID=UPI0014254C94
LSELIAKSICLIIIRACILVFFALCSLLSFLCFKTLSSHAALVLIWWIVGRALKVPQRPHSPFDDTIGGSASAPASIVDSFLGGDNTQSLAPTNPFTSTVRPGQGSPLHGYERRSWTPSILEPEGASDSGGNAVADLEAFFSSPSVSPSGTPTHTMRSGMLPPTNSQIHSTNSFMDPGFAAYNTMPPQPGNDATNYKATTISLAILTFASDSFCFV